MAIPDGGELIVLAPGVKCFGENEDMDRLIRKYGYRGTDEILKAVEQNRDLQESLSRQEVEKAGFSYGKLSDYRERYDIKCLKEGWNTLRDGEEIYYISNPALGLWTESGKFPK